jgi:hypothetical protein
MRFLSLSPESTHRLQHFRRRTWVLIALCLVARSADSAFGLNLVEHTETVAAQHLHACPIPKETLI